MTRKLLSLLLLFNIFHTIHSRTSSLQCWVCEKTIESIEEPGEFLNDCNAQFDFTEHTVEECDGKCWKSVDILDIYRLGNNSRERSKLRDVALSALRSSRRCFTADELLRAAEMGISTTSGCRQVKMHNDKMKEVCFCADQDMCNRTNSLSFSLPIHLALIFFSSFRFVFFMKKKILWFLFV